MGEKSVIPFVPAGVATERGYVKVDAYQRTNVPGVYAIGDVTGDGKLAIRGGYAFLHHLGRKQRAEREDVGARVGVTAFELLRRHVLQRAEDGPPRRQLAARDVLVEEVELREVEPRLLVVRHQLELAKHVVDLRCEEILGDDATHQMDGFGFIGGGGPAVGRHRRKGEKRRQRRKV